MLDVKIHKTIKFVGKIVKHGGSFYLHIPSDIAKKLQLNDKDSVVAVISKLEIHEVVNV